MFGFFIPQKSVFAVDAEGILSSNRASAAAARAACLKTGAVPSTCPPEGIENSLQVVGDKIISPAFRIALIQALLNLSQFVLNRLAYEAAVAIASGGPGEESLFYQQTPVEAFKQLGLEAAGEAIGTISELSSTKLGIEFNLCQPNNSPLQLALAVGIKQKYKPTKPKCDILEIGKNWSGLFTNFYQTISDPDALQKAVLTKFAESLKPGKNELSATLRVNIAIDQKVHEQKLLQFLQQNQNQYKSVTDFITGNVKTPSQTLQGEFESKLKEVNGDQSKIKVGELVNSGELIGGLALSTASTFTNTLLSQLMNRIYTGLFESEPIPDPFDVEGVGGSDRESAQERFASIIATHPIATAEYNALSEFVVCTAEGVTNRGLYNCVMDVNFLAAVSRGNSGSALTVQEAIDEGLLDGNKPLISPENEPANQDPYCYTYGYCYGNLVKLRKARVLPIGWELAALRNSETTPATLQEVIDGFNHCTEDGTIGPSNSVNSDTKWCHLIDPNWVLKYPETQCRAIVSGEIRLSTLSPGRSSVCVDAPSCIGENNEGVCTDGYGYCVQEKNVWRFRGDECPAEYASCLSFQNTQTGDPGDFLVNTVDYSVCDQNNAGCQWYRTNKYLDDAGTSDDTSDDTYVWLPEGEAYITMDVDSTTSDHDDDLNYQTTSGGSVSPATYTYTSDSGNTYTYTSYTYQDRLYLTHNAQTCADSDAGCTKLFEFDEDLVLNAVQNPSFEDDTDEDGFPDYWVKTVTGGSSEKRVEDGAAVGSSLFQTDSSSFYQYVPLQANNFYTLSFYAKTVSTSAGSTTLSLSLEDKNGSVVSIAGTSYQGDCSPVSNTYSIVLNPASTSQFTSGEWSRFDCTFTAPSNTVQANISVDSDALFLDGIQLELGEDVHSFAEGYSSTPVAAYYKMAPDYLGCSGSSNDPSECDNYTQACQAQDVGCNLYTPEDGDPSIPAIISELDQCPSECVGYTTYKQEATDYESESFPLYFIASSASSCSQQYVGCDSFTNLNAVSAGGEGIEYYTSLRSCLSSSIADGSNSQKTPATFFTWEGSDNEGYQLQTWVLLESNLSATTGVFTQDPFTSESSPDLAPCTHIQMLGENEVTCDDGSTNMAADVWGNAQCDEHADIFENPDCREFFDTQGNMHYREYTQTVSVSDDCSPYRKDEGNELDCGASGGYWTDQGFCRYYALPAESTTCPAEQNGCREYTGGTGRNATTILDETFEGGTYEDFVIAQTGDIPEVSISNESVATEGHSLRVEVATGDTAGIDTVQVYLGPSNTSTYDEDVSTTCTGVVGETGCEIEYDVDGDGSADEACIVSDGEESCGTLTSSLVSGKTFVLDFWAKGNGNLFVTLEEEGGDGQTRDFSNPTKTISSPSDLTPVALDGAWTLYSLGPLDTSSFEQFDENAVLRFSSTASSTTSEFYIDNITLKQVEENITLIKDSWVVPSTCDQTPSGADSPQYYLGCEAYTDQHGTEATLYQFSDICSEEVVGCEGFFDTANSESTYQQMYNVRCVYSTDTDLIDSETVASNTACKVNDKEYCTISAGLGYCTFDATEVFEQPLPLDNPSSGLYFGIVYGPETVVIEGDTPVYLVTDSQFACTSEAMGCEEVGLPTYNQDHSAVESFESSYYINLPSDYGNILCDHEALFCEEWSSTNNGNFYFKDPQDKTCEYKTTVSIENRSYFGWFRTGTSEPCYWEDKDDSGDFNIDTDESYLIAGEQFGIWRNGDEDDGDDDLWDYYDGWVAGCESKYDLCTEFIDVVDTESGSSASGESYYFTNDELLDESNLTDSQRCNGQISQKFGCALFNNSTISELSYNAGASYVSSIHADILYGQEQNTLVDPISCALEDGGVFTISSSDAEILGLAVGDVEVDLCARRCAYQVDSGDSIATGSSELGTTSTTYYERSCLADSDCPVLTTVLGESATGSCGDVASDYALQDDSNEILKVNRDRTCSAWLACESSRTSWNTSTNKYDLVCDSVNLCTEGSVQGDRSVCTQWDQNDPAILSAYTYSTRDVNWTGFEYSGNAIPNQLPIEIYDQFNISPQAVCVDASGNKQTNENDLPISCRTFEDCPLTSVSCNTDADCTSANYGACDQDTNTCYFTCQTSSETDYRLVYNAGPCDARESGSGNGGLCYVGHCSETGAACATSGDCEDTEECVVGYCQATADTNCVNENCSCNPEQNETDGTNADCAGSTAGTSSAAVSTPFCDPVQFICVSELTSDEANRDACLTTAQCGTSSTRSSYDCIPSDASTTGSCFNDRCLSDIVDENGDRKADRLVVSDAREESCRAYPEIDSPFPSSVVSSWLRYDGLDIEDDEKSPTSVSSQPESSPSVQRSFPYSYVNGFQDSNVCGLDEDGNVVDCLCSYEKAEYGEGSGYRYYETGTGIESDDIPDGICSGGLVAGIPCKNDADCTSEDKIGSCSYLSRLDTFYGWAGYCIERDTSIQTLGSSAQEDQACLSWLPVDQLTGATDLYAKYTSAGYSPQNTYYCAEVNLTYDIRTTGIGCAEVQDNNCNNDGTWGAFKDEADNSDSGQDDCVAAVWCPDGYFAVMTGCGDQSFDEMCLETWGDNDCPFFCVPKYSYKSSGEPCLAPTIYSYHLQIDDVGDHWSSPKPDTYVYVLQPNDFGTAKDFYLDCAVKGVVDGSGGHIAEYYTPRDNFGAVLPTDGGSTNGYRDLGFNYQPYAACTSVVQVSTKTLEEGNDTNLPFDTYNAAWTNRLWKDNPTFEPLPDPFADQTHFGYQYPTLLSPYGAALDYLQKRLDLDPYPHPLVMCESDRLDQTVPAVDLSCPAGYDSVTSDLGEEARAYQTVAVTNTTENTSIYCVNDDCSCSGGDSALCNYDASIGATISCGNAACAYGSCSKGGAICYFQDTNSDGYDDVCGKDDGPCNRVACYFQDTDENGADDICGPSSLGSCIGWCIGGPYNGQQCGTSTGAVCEPNYCKGTTKQHGRGNSSTSYECTPNSQATTYAFSATNTVADVVARLGGVFGRMYKLILYDDGYAGISDVQSNDLNFNQTFGSFDDTLSLADLETYGLGDWIWDRRGDREDPETYVPKIFSVGECEGSECYESTEGAFTVNEVDSGIIQGEGSKRTTVNFFASADSEQMPIRRVVVDWGDDFAGITGDMPWPTGSYSGSIARDNFYKNHRGLNPISNTEECSATATEFGDSPEACSSSYFSFTHDYTCTAGRLQDLQSASDRECSFDENGRLLNSPCYDGNYCVFQPRVHVMDNWGWCTGFCDSGADETEGCFTGELPNGSTQDECDIESCPSGGDSESCEDSFGGTTNPWVNFDGSVYILAE